MTSPEHRFDEDFTPLKLRFLLRSLAHPYGSFKRPELFAVLQRLGWHVRPSVGLQPVEERYEGSGASTRLREARNTEDFRTEKDALRRLEGLKRLQVPRRPKEVEANRAYLIDVRYEPTAYGHTVSYGGWNAVEAWTISDPSGNHSFVLMPERYARVRKRDRIKPDDLIAWIRKNTDLPARAKEVLDEHEQQRRAVVADTDSGTCGACLRNIKLEEKPGAPLAVMVLHGYRRPGTGRTHGRCIGVGYPPYELSPEATKLVLLGLEQRLATIDAYIEALLAPTLTEFDETAFDFGMGPRIVTKASAGAAWPMLLQQHMQRVRARRDTARRERDVFLWLVQNWKRRPLPVPGERALDWYSEALRHVR